MHGTFRIEARFQHDAQERRTGNDEASYLVYLNPPVVGAVAIPLTLLPPRVSYVAAVGVLALVAIAAAALFSRLLNGVPVRRRWLALICIAGSTAMASGVLSGQLTPILLLVGASALLALGAGRVLRAGALLGLLAVKPHFALAVFLVLLLAGQRKLAAAMAAVAALAALTSVAVVGIDGATGYIELLRTSFSHPASLYIDVRSEQNLSGLLALFGIYGGGAVALAGTAVAVLLLYAVHRAVKRAPYDRPDRALYIAALAAMFVCSAAAHIQFYDLALLAFPAIFILRRAEALPPQSRARCYGVLVLGVLWVEAAGMLAGARLSVSFPPLIAGTLVICYWPRVELFLAGGQAWDRVASEADEDLRTTPRELAA
jgi:hypothetical protein